VADWSRENSLLHDAIGHQFLDCGARSWICNAPLVPSLDQWLGLTLSSFALGLLTEGMLLSTMPVPLTLHIAIIEDSTAP